VARNSLARTAEVSYRDLLEDRPSIAVRGVWGACWHRSLSDRLWWPAIDDRRGMGWENL